MSQLDDYLAKAKENLASCESELAQRRYNSCVRSAYYACFHAAIVALMQASVMPMASETLRGHDWVQAQFVGQLIHRRKYLSGSSSPDLVRAVGDATQGRLPQCQYQST